MPEGKGNLLHVHEALSLRLIGDVDYRRKEDEDDNRRSAYVARQRLFLELRTPNVATFLFVLIPHYVRLQSFFKVILQCICQLL